MGTFGLFEPKKAKGFLSDGLSLCVKSIEVNASCSLLLLLLLQEILKIGNLRSELILVSATWCSLVAIVMHLLLQFCVLLPFVVKLGLQFLYLSKRSPLDFVDQLLRLFG